MSRIYLLSLIFYSLGSLSVASSQINEKIDPSLIKAFDHIEKAEYIVLLKDRKVFHQPLPLKTKMEKANYVYNSLMTKAENTQSEILKILKENNVPFRAFYVINAIKVTSDIRLMKLLAHRSDVAQIIDDAPIRMLDYIEEKTTVSSRNPEPEWGIKYIKADSVWMQGFKGQGVIVGGQDTGYDWLAGPLKTKYKGYIDSTKISHDYHWHDAIVKNNPVFPDTVLNPCGYSLKEPCDDNNHGTHTMGTMVGEDNENSIGVAPEAKWIACRNMDRGWGQPSTYMDCFEWFLAPFDLNGENPDPQQAPHVINNSWYCSVEEGCNASNFVLMDEMVRNLKASGIMVVVSAGNNGSAGCGSVTGPPGFFEASFSVGATDINGDIAGFSSRGPVVIDSSFRLKPNVAAPGVGVRSVIKGGRFAAFSGTSMAGPHVAGLVALIISANPELAGNVEAIEDILEGTAIPKPSTMDCGDFLGTNVPNAVFGYGITNALDAVKRAQTFSTNVKDTDINILTVYPNPTDDLLTFRINTGDKGIEKISLYNFSGQLVLNQSFNQPYMLTTIDLSPLKDGIYMYAVKAGDNHSFGKVVIL